MKEIASKEFAHVFLSAIKEQDKTFCIFIGIKNKSSKQK
jgi:hypothetical protein